MSLSEASLTLPTNFSGVVKLFPLPNLVLFPGVIQPLHIYEHRYRHLLQDALHGDELVAMALLRSPVPSEMDEPSSLVAGPANSTLGGREPAIYRTVCIGKIVTHTRLPDGRVNLLLLGVQKGKIVREIASELPYRLADVKPISNPQDLPVGKETDRLRAEIVARFRRLASGSPAITEEVVGSLLDPKMEMGLFLDLVTFSCNCDLVAQQSVLETNCLRARAERVLQLLRLTDRNLGRDLAPFCSSLSDN